MGARLKMLRSLRLDRVVLVAIVALTPEGLIGHHSAPLNYDLTRRITLEGTLTEVTWRNPHARFRIRVRGADGSEAEWLAEMNAANTLRRNGFPMERFHVRDRVTVMGYPGRRDRTLLLLEVTLADGTRINPAS